MINEIDNVFDYYNGWSNPETFHFYDWLTESEDRFISALECSSITELREFFSRQTDIPNGIDLDYVNWFELYDTLNNNI